MPTTSPDFRDIFPVTVELWQGRPMPEYLYVQNASEPYLGLDDETCDDEPIGVSHDGGRTVVLRQVGSMLVQVVGDDRASRGTVVGRKGCIDALQAALERLLGGKWPQARIAEFWGEGATNERRLRRTQRGGESQLCICYGARPRVPVCDPKTSRSSTLRGGPCTQRSHRSRSDGLVGNQEKTRTLPRCTRQSFVAGGIPKSRRYPIRVSSQNGHDCHRQ